MANDLIDHAYVIKPPSKPKRWGLERFWVGEGMEIRGWGVPGEGMEVL